jgi:hypothetical protein
MKSIILTLMFFLSLTNIAIAQEKGFSDPDSILVSNIKQPKVLLIGSWHFNYPGLDAHKAEESDKINIYSDKRQKELKELLDYISKFKPTKILVESGVNTGYLKYNYDEYINGKAKLYANERSQIGMRLVNRFKLDTIYGVDAWPLLLELDDSRDTLKPKGYTDKILERHYFGCDDEISRRYKEFYDYNTKMTVKKSLLENFKYLNNKKVLNRGFGAYIAGGQFDSEDFEGPDALSMFWINRNLRIFKNIKDIEYNDDDRILILFGSGHISILHWLFTCSPEFDLIDFNELGE